ncbi:tRNA(Ile)-lysidine synthase [Candidatus Carsonella ruddii]|uniref:Putative tRNA(Ile)-lysidine synthase n=1 Tax=Candidatus Carsonella ruddii CE isolate Thao2000 TaxID=1202536 RepID=J7GS06_CARRU|nr:tRNA(Ile)-lysidine synthase [Candidatus Carsonella ruddii]AFP83497.1 putative tRNA(Ile)-lysidine synthase [Candidatus Carsonella ruddii CE isolate Thao2000]
MKNIFLIKKINNLFSFGKDSIYFFFNCYFKKKKFIYFNYNLNIFKNLFLIYKILKISILIIIFKKNFFNEFFLRKLKFSFLKKKKNIIFTNHHYLDNLEYKIIKFLKNKILINYYNNWFFKKNFLIKPYIYIFLKNYNLSIIDKTNKNIFIERNFIRCLISKFLKNRKKIFYIKK